MQVGLSNAGEIKRFTSEIKKEKDEYFLSKRDELEADTSENFNEKLTPPRLKAPTPHPTSAERSKKDSIIQELDERIAKVVCALFLNSMSYRFRTVVDPSCLS